MPAKSAKHVTGNVGLYFVSYKLSQLGWNAMLTSRNCRGIDLVICSSMATRMQSVQVKSFSARDSAALGKDLSGLIADWFLVCCGVYSITPVTFVLTKDDVRNALLSHGPDKAGYWLDPRDYSRIEFQDRWDRIGSGIDDMSV